MCIFYIGQSISSVFCGVYCTVWRSIWSCTKGDKSIHLVTSKCIGQLIHCSFIMRIHEV